MQTQQELAYLEMEYEKWKFSPPPWNDYDEEPDEEEFDEDEEEEDEE
jgi:hypothetical protein